MQAITNNLNQTESSFTGGYVGSASKRLTSQRGCICIASLTVMTHSKNLGLPQCRFWFRGPSPTVTLSGPWSLSQAYIDDGVLIYTNFIPTRIYCEQRTLVMTPCEAIKSWFDDCLRHQLTSQASARHISHKQQSTAIVF